MIDYKKEIIAILEDIEDILPLKLIYGFTKGIHKEEQAVKRIENAEKRGACS